LISIINYYKNSHTKFARYFNNMVRVKLRSSRWNSYSSITSYGYKPYYVWRSFWRALALSKRGI